MRSATLRDLNIRWCYWLVPLGFGIAGVAAFLAIKSEPESQAALVVCGFFFCAVSLLTILWPVLRTQEKQGIQFTSVRLGEVREGILIPMSKVKIHLFLIGGSIFGIGSLLAMIFADSAEDRVKGGIAFLAYAALGVLWFRRGFQRKCGIFLAEDGIIWQEPLLAPCFVPWKDILLTRIYNHPEQYGTMIPAFGLRARNIDNLNLDSGTKNKLIKNFKKFGWHLYFNGESLLLPLELVESTVGYYLSHPEHRSELSNGVAVGRLSMT